jgi:hypothetical protein
MVNDLDAMTFLLQGAREAKVYLAWSGIHCSAYYFDALELESHD